MEIFEYLEEQRFDFEVIEGNLFSIAGAKYLYIEPKDGIILSSDFSLAISRLEETISKDFYVFKLGSNFFYSKDASPVTLNPFKWMGKVKNSGIELPHLGVRGGYEILNGSGVYKNWVKKAKFLGCNTIGICEKNTLAGTLIFQLECASAGIHAVIGETVTVRSRKDFQYDIKLYPKSKEGWRILLLINKEINVVNHGFIWEDDLFKFFNEEELFLVLDPKSMKYEDFFLLDLHLSGKKYYQLDTVEYVSDERDKEYLLNLSKFVKSDLEPIAILDSFYIDNEDFQAKKILNSIANTFENESENQYFKDLDAYYVELSTIFKDPEPMFTKAYQNLFQLISDSKFVIETKNRHLPEYRLTEEELAKYGDKDSLLWGLIQQGVEKKLGGNLTEEYAARIQEELEVIVNGGVVDYFLILHDIISWCRRNDILVGIARGSAGGSMIAFLLEITQIDPIKYDLLFSRFLNAGRIEKQLPDIDTDFPMLKRGSVKKYMEERFGHTQVCAVGTYTTMKVKAGFKDLCKLNNVSFQDANYITGMLDHEASTFEDFMKLAVSSERVKDFTKKYPEIVNCIPLIVGQPRAKSIHACAMMILPDNKEMFEWVPIREQDGDYVTEWEGNEMDSAGFLKEDILGVKELDKFEMILKLIKQLRGEDIDVYNIPVDDPKVYDYFQNGWNGDVFHFGSKGLTKYCKQLKPVDIEDLIAAISLYRPGAMENNFHNEYIKRRSGEKEVEYIVGAEPILNKTYGVFTYQESVMQLCRVLGGLTMVEADDVRKAMVKKKYEELTKYKERFIPYYIDNFGVSQEYAEDVWDTIDKASTYLFNRSHAAAYTLTGYAGQWFKVHYPLEFWVTSFNFADDPEIPYFISEIQRTEGIKLQGIDINKSEIGYSFDVKSNSIFWGVKSIKGVGDVASSWLLEEREKNGEYFSFEEFLARVKITGSKVNKSHILSLILCGAFDIVENIPHPMDRISLVKFYCKFFKDTALEGDFVKFSSMDWLKTQKSLCGLALFDYNSMYSGVDGFFGKRFLDIPNIEDGDEGAVGGYVLDMVIRSSKKGEYADIILENNYDILNVKIWADTWGKLTNMKYDLKGELIILNGKVQYDSYKDDLILFTTDKTEFQVFK